MNLRLRLAGIPIEIRPSFLVIILLLGLTVGIGPTLVAWVALASIAVLVHELGHAVAVLAYGGAPRIVLLASGGITVFEQLGARRHLVVALAGPIAGAMPGLVLLALMRLAPGLIPRDLEGLALFITLGWSALNLLPVGGLDGRAALESLLTVLLGRPAPAIVRVAGVVAVVGLVAVTLALRLYAVTFMVAWVAVVSELPGLALGMGRQAPGGDSLLAMGRPEQALALTDERLARGQAGLGVWLVRADALRVMTRWPEAEEVYAAILADHPDEVRALAGRSQALRMLGRAPEADVHVERLLALATAGVPEAAPAAFIGLYHAGRHADALRLAEAHMAAPGTSSALRARTDQLQLVALTVMGQAEEALPRVDQLLRNAPDRADLHETRALVLVQLGRAGEACRSADHALAAMAGHAELLETAGMARRLAGRRDDARDLLFRAATSRPSLPRALGELATCNADLGRLDEAEAGLAAIPPWLQGDPHVSYARACIAARRGDVTGAAALVAEAERGRPCLGRVARWDPVFAGTGAGAAEAEAGGG
jgi:tetratricopeptide (TPR) repeat protein